MKTKQQKRPLDFSPEVTGITPIMASGFPDIIWTVKQSGASLPSILQRQLSNSYLLQNRPGKPY